MLSARLAQRRGQQLQRLGGLHAQGRILPCRPPVPGQSWGGGSPCHPPRPLAVPARSLGPTSSHTGFSPATRCLAGQHEGSLELNSSRCPLPCPLKGHACPHPSCINHFGCCQLASPLGPGGPPHPVGPPPHPRPQDTPPLCSALRPQAPKPQTSEAEASAASTARPTTAGGLACRGAQGPSAGMPAQGKWPHVPKLPCNARSLRAPSPSRRPPQDAPGNIWRGPERAGVGVAGGLRGAPQGKWGAAGPQLGVCH